MKRSVYEFEQKVRAMWEDKDSLAAYPFGRRYEALDMTGGNPKLHNYRPRYESQMRIFRNNAGQLFIKLRMSDPGYPHDEVYILQPNRTVDRVKEEYEPMPDTMPGYKSTREKKVVRFTGWHTILVGPGFPNFTKGMKSFGRQVDDETVFETINNMSMDFDNPHIVTWMP